MFLMPPRSGRLIDVRGWMQSASCPHCIPCRYGQRPADWVDRVAGRVTLVADDPSALDHDIGVIRQWQQAGIFVVEEAPKPCHE